jgi:hypothetical protein
VLRRLRGGHPCAGGTYGPTAVTSERAASASTHRHVYKQALELATIGSLLIYLLYGRGFDVQLPPLPTCDALPMSAREIRTVAITVGASALWLTDSIHHWHPVVPALLTWSEFERDIGWTNFFVLASSLSLARDAHRVHLGDRDPVRAPCREASDHGLVASLGRVCECACRWNTCPRWG